MEEPYVEVVCYDTDPAGEVVTAVIRHGAAVCMVCGLDDHEEAVFV